MDPKLLDPKQLHDDLTFTDRMIAESEHHIAQLKATIAEMSRDGQDTDLACDVLATFTAALSRHEAQRKVIMNMMQRKAS
jgi:hypothetical protein